MTASLPKTCLSLLEVGRIALKGNIRTLEWFVTCFLTTFFLSGLPFQHVYNPCPVSAAAIVTGWWP